MNRDHFELAPEISESGWLQMRGTGVKVLYARGRRQQKSMHAGVGRAGTWRS